MENNNGFTLKDVIFNLLFIILFVFILLWLFPSKYFLNDKGIYNSDEAQSNHIFNENIDTMKEAAISYFTTSRLPKNVGDSVTMTLRQMRDKKLLLSLIDSNNNVCDEGISYIEMTKEKDEYVLKVTLSCSDYDDYILVHLGCYDYCDGDICEKQEEEILYQYQYKLETPCKWTDWSNFSAWSTNYIAANANRKVETKVETETVNTINIKSCKTGYTYDVATNRCYKSSTSTNVLEAEKVTTYKCNEAEGYVFDEKDKKCKKTIEVSASVAAKENAATYNCNKYPGYTLVGNKCVKTITTTTTVSENATPVYSYKCPVEGGTISADGKYCTVQTTTWDTFDATKTCSTKTVRDCSSGTCSYVPQTSCTYTCPNGYSRTGTLCYGTTYGSENVTLQKYVSSYECSSGTPNGSTCLKEVTNTSTDTKEADKNQTTYYCENTSHTLEGKLCKYVTTKVETEEAETVNTYKCDKYSGYILNGTKCEKIVESTESIEATIQTVCPSGYTMNNNKCTRNIIKYRYSEKSCVGGSVDYKWSNSEKDEELLKLGYVLTGVKQPRESK